jgi:hypothetical protein
MELTIEDLKQNLMHDITSLNEKSDYSFICKNSNMILPNKRIVGFKIINFKILFIIISNF